MTSITASKCWSPTFVTIYETIFVLRNVFLLPIQLQQKGLLSRIVHPIAIIGFVPLIVRVPRNGVVNLSICLNDDNCVVNVVAFLMKSRCFESVLRTPEQQLQRFDRFDIDQGLKQKLNLFVVSGRLQN